MIKDETMPAGRHISFLVLVMLIGSSGCGNHQRHELLESELRARDVQMRDLLTELGKTEGHNDALRHEVSVLRKGARISPEQAGAVFGLRRIALGRGTGAIDEDRMPGDEALAVFVEPRDHDDHIIKIPGSKLQIFALEINSQGLKMPLCSWEIGAEAMRQSWKQGLLSTGYSLILPWKVFPHTENVRVVVRMLLPDDRLFEADKDIKVRLVPGKSLADPDHEPEYELPPPPLEPRPEVGPPPRPLTDPNLPGPLLVPPAEKPAGLRQRSEAPRPAIVPAGRWEPAPLIGAVRLGTPVPFNTPPPPLPKLLD